MIGRPKGARNKATEFIRPIAQRHGPDCIHILYKLALNPKTVQQVKVRAIELLLAYGYGKPTESLELSGAGGGPIRMSTVDEKQHALDALLEQVGSRQPEAIQ